MKSPQKLKLIDGCFTPDESRALLMNVFSSKIQFHQMKNFSSRERFGKDDKAAVKRIAQLKKCLERLQKLTEAAAKKEARIEIKSDVIIHYSS